MDNLTARIANLDALPALPQALSRLITLLGDDDRDGEEIARIVGSDRALSLTVLRAANSAAMRGSVQIHSVAQAVARLGAGPLLRLTISQMSGQVLSRAGKGYGLEGQSSWEGALAGGLAAEILARGTGVDPAIAFTSALLRDCGKLAMDALCGVEEMQRVLAAKDGNQCQMEFERLAFSCDHAEAGAILVHAWGLSDDIVSAVRWHHEPAGAGGSLLVDIVHAGDMVAAQLGFGIGLDGLSYTLDEAAIARIGISQNRYLEVMADTSVKLDEFISELKAIE